MHWYTLENCIKAITVLKIPLYCRHVAALLCELILMLKNYHTLCSGKLSLLKDELARELTHKQQLTSPHLCSILGHGPLYLY